jgi:integrase
VSTSERNSSSQLARSRLTASQVAGLRPRSISYDMSDPAVSGLVLRIGVSGSKTWLFRFKFRRKPIRMSLGAFPNVSLAQARADALEFRELLDRGIDPRKAQRRQRRTGSKQPETEDHAVNHGRVQPEIRGTSKETLPAPPPDDRSSVEFLAYEYVQHFVIPGRDSPDYVVRILRKDVLTAWKGRDARTISAREVVELLDKIVERGSPVMANRTADILGQMFKFGIHRAIVEDSPVKLLYKPGGKERRGKRVLSEQELIAFVQDLDKACRSKQKRHVLMLLLLLLQRRGELGRAEWDEFDFKRKTWRIPDAHTKSRRGHVVPLTDWAISELRALKDLSKGSRFVLPSSKPTRPANPKLITRSVARSLVRFAKVGIAPFKPHDLRRTARTELVLRDNQDDKARQSG